MFRNSLQYVDNTLQISKNIEIIISDVLQFKNTVNNKIKFTLDNESNNFSSITYTYKTFELAIKTLK